MVPGLFSLTRVLTELGAQHLASKAQQNKAPASQTRPQSSRQSRAQSPQKPSSQRSMSGIRYDPNVVGPLLEKVASAFPKTRNVAPFFNVGARYPAETANALKGSAKEALGAVRATLRGAEDQVTAQKANDAAHLSVRHWAQAAKVTSINDVRPCWRRK